MHRESTPLKDVWCISFFKADDQRGSFSKPFSEAHFKEWHLNTQWVECFYSISKPNVLRGMHDQLSPMAIQKLVWVSSGAILDVVLDLRKNSPTFGKTAAFSLTADEPKALYIPEGCAHGFYVTSSTDAQVFYLQSNTHSPQHERGVLWNSFGFPWPCHNPIISERDSGFSRFDEMKV
jgi:dTDP-4-dehydrorhamnose 3,5-epimerase